MDSSASDNSASARAAPRAGFLVLWEFLVKPEARLAFEKAYGPDGKWAQLFRQSAEYLGTDLLRDLVRPERYLTLDRWASRDALSRFKQSHQSAYAALDKRCEALTEHEALLGEFELVNPTGS